jgi:predicted protein tyrosine phosphatase
LSRVLFVCSANLDRSPTAERLFQNRTAGWEAKSAGTMLSLARNPLTQDLLDWADLVLVMEPVHAEFIQARLNCNPSKVRVLNIADIYVGDDPELVHELEVKVPPLLEAIVSKRS